MKIETRAKRRKWKYINNSGRVFGEFGGEEKKRN